MNKFKLIAITRIVPCVALAAAFFSCQHGLGESVDMKGPVLTITKPAFMDPVNASGIEIEGSLQDDSSVESLVIKMEGTNKTWRNFRGEWQENNGDGVWKPMPPDKAEWRPTGGATDPIHFKVTINPGLEKDGNWTIDITAFDANRNASKDSIAQIMVSYDATPPVARVILPELENNPADLDRYQIRDINAVGRLLNGDLVIKWQINDDVSVKKLRILLYRDGDEKAAYDTDNDADVQTELGYGDGRNAQRNGEVAIKKEKLPASRTKLKIVTVVWDNAGNENKDWHGWFVYEPDADAPWTQLPAASDVSAIANYTYYPGGNFSAQAFDDDGVLSVTAAVYAANPLAGVNFSTTPILSETIPNPRESRSFNWKLPLLPSDAGNYKIAATATDINGTPSEEAIGYFSIVDISNPNVAVSSLSDSAPLFGDALGNFTIEGAADDDSDPVELKMVWINPASPASQLSYMSSAYSGWDAADGSADSDGNRVYGIQLGSAYKESGRMAKNFSRNFNLFTDLGISATTPLKNQVFIFRVKDNSGKYLVRSWTTPGDSTPPFLSIEKAHVYDSAGNEKSRSPYAITESLTLPAFESGDMVAVEGRWSDDSTDVWADKTKMGAFTVKWNGAALPASSSLGADGVWITGKTGVPSDSAIAVVTAELRDLTGNAATAATSFTVTTSKAQLLRISSDKDDGVYNSGDIPIYLEFNLDVTLKSSPTLRLNNKNTVSYSGNGNNGNPANGVGKKFYFIYSIPADHSGDTTTYGDGLLDVSAINGGTFESAADGTAVATNRTASNALNASRRIKIDTMKPALSSITAITGAGHYKAGAEIYLKAAFNEDIDITGSPFLSLSSGANAKAVYVNAMGSNSLMFKYTASAGENASPLTASGFSLNGGAIADKGGNAFDAGAALPSGGALDKTLVIDTVKPNPPAINGISAGTYTTARSFTLGNADSGATVEYSIDNGASWAGYTGAVALNYNGTFAITARQTDEAGNVSDKAASIAVTIELSGQLPLFSAITTDTTSGNYTTRKTIKIYFNLTRNIGSVTGVPPSITVNAKSGGKTVNYTGYEEANTRLVFEYTVDSGDNASPLVVTAFNPNGASFASGGSISEIPTASFGSQGLESYASLIIDTSELLFETAEFDAADPAGPFLVLVFNKKIYKGSGNITISQSETDYKAPIVMTRERFNELNGSNRAQGALSPHYSYTTNGADANGSADTTGKYVLNYDKDPNDSSLVFLSRGAASAHVVTMSVRSNYTALDNASADGKGRLKIKLTDSYALEVKGANYEFNFGAGIVQDSFGKTNALYNSANESLPAKKTVYYPGVEKPVIRVEKGKERLVQVPDSARSDYRTPYWTTNPTISFTEPGDLTGWDYVKDYYATGLEREFVRKTDNGWRAISLSGDNDKVGIQVNAGTNSTYSTIKTSLKENDDPDEWIQTSVTNSVQNYNVYYYNSTDNTIGVSWSAIPSGCQIYEGTDIYLKKSAIVSVSTWTEMFYLPIEEYYQKVDSGIVVTDTGTEGAVLVKGYWVKDGSSAMANTAGAVQAYKVTYPYTIAIAEQPLTARLRIDCRTPGAEIRYGMEDNETSDIKTSEGTPPTARGITMPTVISTSYTGALTLGNASNKTSGFKYGIIATAEKDGKTETACEAAYRSVLIYGGIALDDGLGDEKTVQLWVRGGDSTLPGQNMTPGFPISWDDSDYKGIRLMTKDDDVGGWYWVTWELATAAYVHFVEGSTPETVNDAQNGPLRWKWSKNAWTLQHAYFPLFPGENRKPSDIPGNIQPAGGQEWAPKVGSR
ncbi:MAG: hypothetical protein LBH85_03895 [Treponema sp.]|jgi:hypothetical protein|nr:hypothetical protein [Treponema sp.]